MKKQNSVLIVCFAVVLFFFASNVLAKEEEQRGPEVEQVGQVRLEDDNDLDDIDELEIETEDLEDELDDDSDDATDNDSDEDGDDSKGRGEEHRSEVADFVEKLLYVADRNGGIGEEIRRIAREQASSTDDVAEAIEMVEKRGKFKVFLIGTDYKNLGAIRSELVKTEARIESLKRETEKLIPLEKDLLEGEISALQDEQDKLQSFIEDNEDRFSLFGWVAKLLQ